MTNRRPLNAFLRALSADDWQDLRPKLQEFSLVQGDVLTEMGEPVDWVLFPETGLISVVSILVSGEAVETAIVGCNGAVSLLEALGSGVTQYRLRVQIPGNAYRIKSDDLQMAFRSSPTMQSAVHHQAELLQVEARLAVACNSVHPAGQRLCRWLLECEQLSGGVKRLPLTQKLLSVTLAVQRTTVTRIAKSLQKDGLIRYSRGAMWILNLEGLKRRSCACHATLANLRASAAPAIFPAAASLSEGECHAT